MHHGFDVGLAKKYGVLPAILLEYIAHWVIYNRSLGQNRVDGRFWVYNSLPGMQEQFPYMNERQIRYALDKLREEKLIIVKKLSTDKMDKTNWYTLSDKGMKVCDVVICDETILSDACDKSDTIDATKLSDEKNHLLSIVSTNISNNPKKHSLLATNLSTPLLSNSPTEVSNSLHNSPTKTLSTKTSIVHNNLDNNNITPLPPNKKFNDKIEYAKYVHMKASEYQTLVDKFGEDVTQELIEILDNYKGSKGRTYKDDYRAILSWVVKRWKEDHTEKPQPKSFKQMDQERFLKAIEEMDELYGDK